METYAVQAPLWVPTSWQEQIVGDSAFGAGTQTVTLNKDYTAADGTRTHAWISTKL